MRSETAPFPKGKSTQEQARKTKPAAIYVSSNGTLMAEEEEKDEGEQNGDGGGGGERGGLASHTNCG